ncbi:MAG: hypothetical protein ACRERX_16695, partial [Pseudomonas sp.]
MASAENLTLFVFYSAGTTTRVNVLATSGNVVTYWGVFDTLYLYDQHALRGLVDAHFAQRSYAAIQATEFGQELATMMSRAWRSPAAP